MKHPLAIFLALIVITAPLSAENWPGWRGPRGDGTSQEKNVPVHWSETKNITWKVKVPGIGHSSPVVYGDRIFVTSCLKKEQQRVLMCFDRKNGDMLWKQVVVKASLEKKHRLNSFASSTPVTDGERVYVTFLDEKDVRVVSYDMSGKKVWDISPGQFFSRHGFCSSPILYKDKIIVNCDQDARGKYRAYIVALDRKTGKEIYRIDRPNRIRSYCAPLITKAAGKTQMVLTGCKCVTSYDPEDGKLLWIIDGPTEQYVASPVYTQGIFFITTGFPEFHNMAIKPDGSGNVTDSHVLWHEHVDSFRASYVPSPIAVGEYFFLVSDKGFAHCFEAKTGKRLWMKKLGSHHSASPVTANGLLYFTDDEGITYVLKAGPKYEEVTRNALEDSCYASPAISEGRMYIRSTNYLWCIEEKEERNQ